MQKYIKTITPELIDKLPMSPYVLVTLFLDDGSIRNDCYAGKLATQGFTEPEQQLLRLYFLKWGIDCKVNLHLEVKNQYYLTIPATSFSRLIEIIEPIIINEIPSMSYKLNADRRPRND